MKRVSVYARMALVCLPILSAACIPPQSATAVVIPVNGVETKIEKTTVTVRDPDGRIMRTEEKEMVLQAYTAREPIQLKSAPAPRVLQVHVKGDEKAAPAPAAPASGAPAGAPTSALEH